MIKATSPLWNSVYGLIVEPSCFWKLRTTRWSGTARIDEERRKRSNERTSKRASERCEESCKNILAVIVVVVVGALDFLAPTLAAAHCVRERRARAPARCDSYVSSDSLPIATESHVEIWNAWRRLDGRGRVQRRTRMRACVACSTVRFTRCTLSHSFLHFCFSLPSLSFSHGKIDSPFPSLSLFVCLFPPSARTRVPLDARSLRSYSLFLLRPCSSSECVLACSLARSLTCMWKRCHPSVERCCRLFVPLLLGEYLTSELQLSVLQRFSTASVLTRTEGRQLCFSAAKAWTTYKHEGAKINLFI